MNQDLQALVEELQSDADYAARFTAVFAAPLETRHIAEALASYERTLESPVTAFDRWKGGDDSAINDDAKRGFSLFVGKAHCASCHAGWRFTDDAFHDIGLMTSDIGRGALDVKQMHAFKTPTLRDIGHRAPYMHDGSLPTLDAVLDHYVDGVQKFRRTRVAPVRLSEQERRDLLAFLATLDCL